MLRTHTCGELRKEHAGKKVKLCGWVDTLRLSGKIGFLLLRDRYGITQCFLSKDITSKHGEIRRESVVLVEGEVKARPSGQEKKEMETGDIEVSVSKLEILSEAEPLPMELDDNVTEETRLKYRYLDLRKSKMQKNLKLRSDMTHQIRVFLQGKGFIDIETPVLSKSTPEGARDYLVPSRINKGKFYALPQSPQLYKQLSMIAGFDKYFQIAKCFRDEDLRADRQPEFTQLDLEMSFVEQDDILKLLEELMKHLWKTILNVDIKTPFPRISHAEAVKKYGSDKPHLGEGKKGWHFCWVVDWPMFEENDGEITYAHHPFTMPVFKDKEDIVKKPLETKAFIHDLVLNGEEIGGGSIRCHKTDVQEKIFEALGLDKKEYEKKFGFFLNALKYGAPPHGGIALGLDRIAALMSGEDAIRDVIAFPKTKDAEDLMQDTPSTVGKEQLKDLGISTK